MSQTVQDQVEETLNDMGITDFEFQDQQLAATQLNNIPNNQIEYGTVTTQIIEPIPANQKQTLDKTLALDLSNGIQLKIEVSQRPECPNCGNLPTQSGQDKHLIKCGHSDCTTQVCDRCTAQCHTCNRPLCFDHSSGYSDEGITLCPDHRKDRLQEREFETQLEIWAKQLQQELEKLDREIQFRELRFDKQKELARVEMEKRIRMEEVEQQRDAQEIELKKKKLEESRKQAAKNLEFELERRQKRLEAFKAKLESEDKRKELEVQQFEAETERGKAAMEHQQQMADINRQELESQLETMVDLREQEISEMETRLNSRQEILDWVLDRKELEHEQQLDRSELAVKKREKMLEIAEGMQDLRWDEANQFLDFKERLEGSTVGRNKPIPEQQEEQEEENRWRQPEQNEEDDEEDYFVLDGPIPEKDYGDVVITSPDDSDEQDSGDNGRRYDL